MNKSIKNLRNLLPAIVAAAFLTQAGNLAAQDTSSTESATTSQSVEKKKTQSGAQGDASTIQVPILMFVPLDVSADVENKGCWVKMYDKKNYEGDSLMLTGPINMPVMVGPFGFNWENKVRSLKTGPKANLTIYDNRNFRDQDKFIQAQSNVPDLSKKMGFFDDFRSMMLSCL
ncbi:MAG TPA: beta/gamma crystallin domain-containing protein [Nitrosospira sp.]|nr:beta/gamma crystallin domain-containing protein [Nitrosospira sp.]